MVGNIKYGNKCKHKRGFKSTSSIGFLGHCHLYLKHHHHPAGLFRRASLHPWNWVSIFFLFLLCSRFPEVFSCKQIPEHISCLFFWKIYYKCLSCCRYIGVGENEMVQLFYYFVESQRSPSRDPVLIWISGGPGCSALGSFFFESGMLLSFAL